MGRDLCRPSLSRFAADSHNRLHSTIFRQAPFIPDRSFQCLKYSSAAITLEQPLLVFYSSLQPF